MMRFRSTFIMTDYFNKLEYVGWKASKYCYVGTFSATSVHFIEYLAGVENFGRTNECMQWNLSVLDAKIYPYIAFAMAIQRVKLPLF